MKGCIAILLALACVLFASAPAFAAQEAVLYPAADGKLETFPVIRDDPAGVSPDGGGETGGRYATIGDLYQAWEQNGYPDDVGGVFSTDGGSDRLTVLLVNDDGTREAEIRALLIDDSNVTFGSAKYAHNALRAVQDEIAARYLGQDDKVFGIGTGWTSVNGVVTGFGESGKESRVVVSVDESAARDYAKEFDRLYGDMVVVEAGEAPVLLEDTASRQNSWLPPLVITIMVVGTASVLLFRRTRPVPARQTANGTILARPAPMGRKDVIDAVKNSEIAPRGEVLRSILQKIEEDR